MVGQKLTDTSVKLERNDYNIDASRISSSRQGSVGNYHPVEFPPDPADSDARPQLPAALPAGAPSTAPESWSDGWQADGSGMDTDVPDVAGIFLELDEADEEYEDDVEWSSDSEDYDMNAYDDDGESLYDESGASKVFLAGPGDEDLTDGPISETAAAWVLGFASAYKQVRGKLQATKIGRDQKAVRKVFEFKNRVKKGKGKGKRRPKGEGKGKKRFGNFNIKPNDRPRRPKVFAMTSTGKGQELKQSDWKMMQRIRCYNC